MKVRILTILMVLLPLCAIAQSDIDLTPSRRLPLGIAGGAHLAITVNQRNVELDFDCARAFIPFRPILSSRGEFSAQGTYTRLHGGPIRPGGRPDIHSASFRGHLIGRQLWLEILVQERGSYQRLNYGPLQYGEPGRVFRCL